MKQWGRVRIDLRTILGFISFAFYFPGVRAASRREFWKIMAQKMGAFAGLGGGMWKKVQALRLL